MSTDASRFLAVNEKGISKIKLVRKSDGEAAGKTEESMEIGNVKPVDSQAEPTISQEERDDQRRAQDLERLRVMDIEKRRQIAHLDMMGDYGSKVRLADIVQN